MKLSTKGKYSLYAMYYLAQHAGDGPQPLKAVATIGIQEDYLEQLLGTLRKGQLVTTVRGAQGGYQLARTPEEITVGDILNATEGPLNLSDCLRDKGSCQYSGECKARRVWNYLTDNIDRLMDSITLRDMLEQEEFGAEAEIGGQRAEDSGKPDSLYRPDQNKGKSGKGRYTE